MSWDDDEDSELGFCSPFSTNEVNAALFSEELWNLQVELRQLNFTPAHLLCLLEVELNGVVAAVEGIVARRLVGAELDEYFAGALELLDQLLPDDDDVAVESYAGRLKECEIGFYL